MDPTLNDLPAYVVRILPGLLLITGCLALARRDPLLRILLLVLGFVLIRDAMTPLGFWRLGAAGEVVPWLRFVDSTAILLAFGTTILLLTATVLRLDRGLRELVRWGRVTPQNVALGIGGGLLAAAPVLLISQLWPLDERGGAVSTGVLPALLFFALAGNLAEEVLFRGFLQGQLHQRLTPNRAALLSGLFFAACHAFLAATVTSVGWPLLVFTLVEGLICAFLCRYRGLVPAVLAHGTAIFALGSGLA
ncbi:CPBP family intramembrane glutamic endopeptidase [Kribbella sp. DT2]|uniref:CPBP family intramembrane glutamic endopeptidase n=1 Tax=Kribbella sp. DT2 TaxID=3393427 RepID=UPI003CF5E831